MDCDYSGLRKLTWQYRGRGKVRTVLYIVYYPIRPKIKAMYERLILAGKPKKVALVACMRKQLTIFNTMMKNSTHWDEKFA